MGKYNIKFKSEVTKIENPEDFEFKFSEETGLSIGDTSTDIDLVVKILTQNTTEGQINIKAKQDTTKMTQSMNILQAVQSHGMLDIIHNNERFVEIIITRIS